MKCNEERSEYEKREEKSELNHHRQKKYRTQLCNMNSKKKKIPETCGSSIAGVHVYTYILYISILDLVFQKKKILLKTNVICPICIHNNFCVYSYTVPDTQIGFSFATLMMIMMC